MKAVISAAAGAVEAAAGAAAEAADVKKSMDGDRVDP